VAGSAVGEDPRVPARALVTAWTLDPLDADALASGLVTLWCLNAPGVTVTGSALHVGVSPEELLALAAGAASEAGHALTLSRELVARRPEGMSGIAAARVTAGPAGQLPGVGRTAVAVLPEHIGKTQALARGSVAPAVGAVAVLLPRAQGIADTLSTVLPEGVPIVPGPADLALLPLRVVQALEAPPRLLVAGFRVGRVDVVVTLARLTGAPHVRGIAKEAWGTVVTPGADVPRITDTSQLQSHGVLITAIGELASAVGTVWARTRAAVIS